MSAGPTLELLRFAAEDRVPLNALYYSPEAPAKSLVILVPGLSGPVLGSAHDYRPLAAKVTGGGYALLLLNMRSANTFANSTFEDSAKDIAAAVKHAKSIGITDIALFGTSLGGPRVTYYMANAPDPSVRVVGFLASIKSPYLEAQLRMDAENRARLDAFLQKCRAMVASGQGGEGVTFHDWFPNRPMTLTAKSFLSYFGTLEDSNASTVKFGSKVTVPAVVIHGTKDEIALPPNGQAIYDSLTAAPKREIVWVEGAAHYMTPGWIAETYARIIAEWVAKNMPAPQ